LHAGRAVKGLPLANKTWDKRASLIGEWGHVIEEWIGEKRLLRREKLRIWTLLRILYSFG